MLGGRRLFRTQTVMMGEMLLPITPRMALPTLGKSVQWQLGEGGCSEIDSRGGKPAAESLGKIFTGGDSLFAKHVGLLTP